MRYAIVLLFIIGCGDYQDESELGSTPRGTVSRTVIHPDFKEYVDQFKLDCPQANMKKLAMLAWSTGVRTENTPTRLGTCSYYPERQIDIAIELRGTLEPILMKMLVYHELGHCVLDLDHADSGVIPDEDYTNRMDDQQNYSTCVDDIVNEFEMSDWFGHDAELVRQLQIIHDHEDPHEWPNSLRNFALDRDLAVNFA